VRSGRLLAVRTSRRSGDAVQALADPLGVAVADLVKDRPRRLPCGSGGGRVAQGAVTLGEVAERVGFGVPVTVGVWNMSTARW
jgi:hypothetical protein